MGQAIGDFLPAAVGAAISPFPIIAVVLMLTSARGRVNGPAFLLGWLVGIGVGGLVLLTLAGRAGAQDEGEPADWVSWLTLALGVLLVLLALKQWRGRPHGGEEPVTPKWMGELDSFTPVKAAGAGVVLSVLNPKNLLLMVAAAAAIAQTGIPADEEAIAWIVFTLIASLGVATPIVIYFALGDRAAGLLDRLKTWMADNSAVIMAAILVVIGAKLIGDAISGLSG
jgi:threonine/homoserine/homoserine lactone efflux protein